jgi:hypothetical protein
MLWFFCWMMKHVLGISVLTVLCAGPTSPASCANLGPTVLRWHGLFDLMAGSRPLGGSRVQLRSAFFSFSLEGRRKKERKKGK